MTDRFDRAFTEIERSRPMRFFAYAMGAFWLVGTVAAWLGAQTLQSLINR